MTRRSRLLLAAALAAAVAAGVLAWRWRRSSTSPDQLVVYGNVDVRDVDLAFDVSERIVAVHVEEGAEVRKGDLLAELDDAIFRHEVAEAEARVAAQRATVARLEHGSRPEEIEEAEARLDEAQARLHDARVTLQRVEKLARADASSKQEYDDAQASYRAAKARVDAARKALDLAIEGPRAEDVAAARAELRAAESALALAKHRLEDTRLYAPGRGTILVRILEPGAVVLPSTPVLTLALADPVWVRAYLSETDLGRVRPGMRARISSDARPDRPYEGWVGFISPTAEFTPKTVETPDLRTSLVYRVRIFVHDPDGSLRQGMPVTASILLHETALPAAGSPGAAERHG